MGSISVSLMNLSNLLSWSIQCWPLELYKLNPFKISIHYCHQAWKIFEWIYCNTNFIRSLKGNLDECSESKLCNTGTYGYQCKSREKINLQLSWTGRGNLIHLRQGSKLFYKISALTKKNLTLDMQVRFTYNVKFLLKIFLCVPINHFSFQIIT